MNLKGWKIKVERKRITTGKKTVSDVISPRTHTSILKKGKSPYGEKSVNFFGKLKIRK